MFDTVFSRWTTSGADAATDPDQTYAYKASLIGAAHRYALDDDGLTWRIGRRSGTWRYADIAAVRLSYRPMGMQHRRFRADLTHRDGRRMAILSTSKQTVALVAPQAAYAGFIRQLHRRMAVAGSRAILQAGLRPGVYATLLTLLALLGIAMAALLLRALWIGEVAGVVFIVGFAVFFAWQIDGFLRRNRPRRYGFATLPEALLP